MTKILYFMQVPWDWVKQRPHFIAEGLAPSFDITVVHNKPYTRFKLVSNERNQALKLKEFYVLPFAYLSKVNSLLISGQLRSLIEKSDIVWLTHPFQYHQVKRCIPGHKPVVYDCMDNFLEFRHIKSDAGFRARVFELEEELVRRSDLVVCSSHYLQQMLVERYQPGSEPAVVSNAISMDPAWSAVAADGAEGAADEEHKRIVYIGTVAEWFDFDLIMESLHRNDRIAFHIYGPAEMNIPRHDRLVFHGPIPHGELLAVMRRSDALIMPFKLNDLVLAVNPVKLYEYVYSHTPAIAVRYPETESFEEFVHLYSGRSEFFDLVDKVAAGTLRPKRPQQECDRFAGSNTWQARAAVIAPLLESIAHRHV